MTPDEPCDRLLKFAAHVGKVVDALPETRLGRHVAGQLVRSGTSPAPNYEEACGAESRADFVHKLKIVLKELRESRCWLRLIVATDLLPKPRMVGSLGGGGSTVEDHRAIDRYDKGPQEMCRPKINGSYNLQL